MTNLNVMRYILPLVIIIFISCNSSKKEEATVNSSNPQGLVAEAGLDYPFDPAVEGDQKKVKEEKTTKEQTITKLQAKDTLGDLSDFFTQNT